MLTLDSIRVSNLINIFFRTDDTINLILKMIVRHILYSLNNDCGWNRKPPFLNELTDILSHKQNHGTFEFQSDIKPLQILLPLSPIHTLTLDIKEGRYNSYVSHSMLKIELTRLI